MGLRAWLKARKERKRLAKREAYKQAYLLKFGINHERDLTPLNDVIKLVGDKYLKEVELLLSSTGNGEYLSDKITTEDIPKMVQNILGNLSEEYKLILEVYYGDIHGIMKYIILKLNEYIVKIMLLNRHKINSMNEEYRKFSAAKHAVAAQAANRQNPIPVSSPRP